jgi:hypothetical protein
VGLALVRNSQSDEGIDVLRDALKRHPGSAEAWDGWLTGLDESFQPDLLTREFAHLPESLAADPRFAKYEGTVAQVARDWPRAAGACRGSRDQDTRAGAAHGTLSTAGRTQRADGAVG